jgi:hypothetical protein
MKTIETITIENIEIYRIESSDRYISVTRKMNNDIININYMQGCHDDELKCFKDKYLTEDKELTDFILPKMNWNTPCEIEEIDRLIWKKIEIEEIKRDASEKLNTYRDTVKYFQSLISRTNTYFLSDYVINELDGYVTEEEYKEFCQRLIILEGACYDKGLDIHEISQEVAVPFIEAIGNVTCPNCKHKF